MDSSVTSLRTQDDGAEQHNHSAINPVQTFPELPPQSFTTAAHLLELTDSTLSAPSGPASGNQCYHRADQLSSRESSPDTAGR